MPVNFDQKIKFISTTYLEKYISVEPPQTCPVCNYSIAPYFILIHKKTDEIKEVLCGCPRIQCQSLFFAVYEYDQSFFEFRYFYPSTKEEKDFPEEVSELSPDFEAIYNQAHHAEQEGLDMICGVGYRKALEFLIKDYAISIHKDEEEKIKKMPLNACLQKYIDFPDIKEMAVRAIWLGNDETHYVRKWGSKDIKDLKNLIDLTVFYLSMNLKAKKYKTEMSEK